MSRNEPGVLQSVVVEVGVHGLTPPVANFASITWLAEELQR
jgi:hypothetical protein